MDDAVLDALLQTLLGRHSLGPKHLTEPGPDRRAFDTMALAALRAPDHARLTPFRFAIVEGAQRAALADVFERAAIDAGKTSDAAKLDRERALKPPVSVAVIARIDAAHPVVPAHEQWMTVGGALGNFLMAAHALGFGAKMLSGAKTREPGVVAAFCEPGETLVGWIAMGTPKDSPPQAGSNLKQGPGAERVIGMWEPR